MKSSLTATSTLVEKRQVQGIWKELTALRKEIVTAAEGESALLKAVHTRCRDSAKNLLHYLAFRRHDLRPLQLRLSAQGLSSLGRAESHVLASVDAVLNALHHLVPKTEVVTPSNVTMAGFVRGQRLLAQHRNRLLGAGSTGRETRIMVTMPGDAAADPRLIRDLMKHGMNCVRINCAHDEASVWLRLIKHVRQAEKSLDRSCRVLMDLGGPKLRTGPIKPEPSVLKIRPTRDSYGQVTTPARVWLTSADAPHAAPTADNPCLYLSSVWIKSLRKAAEIKFTDARASKRKWIVTEVTPCGCWAEARKTAYLVPETILHSAKGSTTSVGMLPPRESALFLQSGDLLIISRDQTLGRTATYDPAGKLLTPAMVICTIPEVFEDVRLGESIRFDDGKIGGVIEKIEPTQVHVRITLVRVQGEKLRSDKGINLPESTLCLPPLSAQDKKDLAFVVQHADMVGFSFVNTARDVAALQQALTSLGRKQLPIVLKIETRRGFENLPEILLTAMHAGTCGVMIARGDLAVECGFERMAEVQEEILWVCEAAHVPVIWATQVLETMAKGGIPSRAEITDAAMGERAECVMLNKGPHILAALQGLDDILRHMQSHQNKKTAMLRHLHLADRWPLPKTSNP